MIDLSNESIIVSELLDELEECSLEEADIIHMKTILDDVNMKIDKEPGYELLKLRLKLLHKIIQSQKEMNIENTTSDENEKNITETFQEVIFNLSECFQEIVNEIDDIQSKMKRKIFIPIDEVSDLLEEMTFIHKLSLIFVHELNASMICSRITKPIFDELGDIREKMIKYLRILYEINIQNKCSSKMNSKILSNIPSLFEEKTSLTVDLEVYSTRWKENINVISHLLCKFTDKTDEMGNILRGETSFDVSDSLFIMERIDGRLDHLIFCINNNTSLNYQNEFCTISQALSNIEMTPLNNEIDLHIQVKNVKEKLTKLQSLMENSCKDQLSHSKDEALFIESRISEINCNSIEDSLNTIQKRYEYFTSSSSQIEDNFLMTMLSLKDTVSVAEFNEKDMKNEKLNQYLSLVESYDHLNRIMELYISDNDIIVVNDHTNIDEDMNKIKKVMMELLTTISLLETFNASIEPTCLSDNKGFNEKKRNCTLSLIYKAVMKLIIMQETYKKCLLLEEKICNLIIRTEQQISDLDDVPVINNVWDELSIKKTLYESHLLINICQFYLEKFQCLSLNINLDKLVNVINILRVKECKYLKNSHFNKETSREYWFVLLEEWQEKVEIQLTYDRSLVDKEPFDDECNRFHDCMLLVCEFNQMDSNIDRLKVEFEPTFIDYLISYRSELDKSNKRFIESIIEKKLPIYKILQFISHEIEDLKKQRSINLQTLNIIDKIQRSTQTSLQGIEYIDSLLSKIEDSYSNKTVLVEDQFRIVRTAIHKFKKKLLLENNQFSHVYGEFEHISDLLDEVENSIGYVEVFLDQEVGTMLSDSFLVIINKSQNTLKDVTSNLENINLKIQSIRKDGANQNYPVLETIKKMESRYRKISEETIVISNKIMRFNQVIMLIVHQEDLSCSIKNQLRIYFMKMDIYSSSVNIDLITSIEMGRNYIKNINDLELDYENHMKLINEMEMINNELIPNQDSSDSDLLRHLFDNEIAYFKDCFHQFQALKNIKKNINHKLEIMEKIYYNYQVSIDAIEKIKVTVCKERIISGTKIFKELEKIKISIDNSLVFVHENYKHLNTMQKDKFIRDLEQLESLLDTYDLFINQKLKKDEIQRVEANIISDRNNQYFIEVDNFNKDFAASWTKYVKDYNDNSHFETTENLLFEIIQTRFQILKDCEKIFFNKLQDSEECQNHEECLKIIEKSIEKYKSYTINFLVCKYGLSCEFDDIFNDFCYRWSKKIKLLLDNDSEHCYYKNICLIEVMKILIEIWTTFVNECYKLALTCDKISKLMGFKEYLDDISCSVIKTLKLNSNLNNKIVSFHLLRFSLTTFKEKLNTYLVIVYSLSGDCSIQKHSVMTKQSNLYKELITHHRNRYQLCEKLCDSILEEEIVGFEIDEEIQTDFHKLTEEMRELNNKHESAVVDLEKALSEWNKVKFSQVMTNEQLKFLDEYLCEMTKCEGQDNLKAHLYSEKLDVVINCLENSLGNQVWKKLKTGSSTDQEYINQQISIAKCCMVVAEMITDNQKANFESAVNQFLGFRKECESVKLDTINSLDEMHCLYIETELSLIEKCDMLNKIFIGLSEIEKTASVWHSRQNIIYTSLTIHYNENLENIWKNLQKWIHICWDTFGKVHEIYDEFGSITRQLNIRLNVVQEYMEMGEKCHSFIKNILSRYHLYNSADLQSCLLLTETIMKQLKVLKAQLEELENLKRKLEQLTFGQSEYLEDQISTESRKIADLAEVFTLINQSQSAIKEKLLKIIGPDERKTSNLITSYSSYEEEIRNFSKSVSSSGEVDSYVFINKGDLSSQMACKSLEKIIPLSSLEGDVEQNIAEITNIYTKIMLAINDQEKFLNERWIEEIQNNSKNKSLDQMKINLKENEGFSTSTPTNIASNIIDVHYWFPVEKENCSQTTENSESKGILPQLHFASDKKDGTTISCPDAHITGLTGLLINGPNMENMLINSLENISLKSLEDNSNLSLGLRAQSSTEKVNSDQEMHIFIESSVSPVELHRLESNNISKPSIILFDNQIENSQFDAKGVDKNYTNQEEKSNSFHNIPKSNMVYLKNCEEDQNLVEMHRVSTSILQTEEVIIKNTSKLESYQEFTQEWVETIEKKYYEDEYECNLPEKEFEKEGNEENCAKLDSTISSSNLLGKEMEINDKLEQENGNDVDLMKRFIIEENNSIITKTVTKDESSENSKKCKEESTKGTSNLEIGKIEDNLEINNAKTIIRDSTSISDESDIKSERNEKFDNDKIKTASYISTEVGDMGYIKTKSEKSCEELMKTIDSETIGFNLSSSTTDVECQEIHGEDLLNNKVWNKIEISTCDENTTDILKFNNQISEFNDSPESILEFSSSTMQELNKAPLFISFCSPLLDNHSKSSTVLDSKFPFSNTVNILPKLDTSLGISSQDNEQCNLESEITYDPKRENFVEKKDQYEKITEIQDGNITVSGVCNKVEISTCKENTFDILEFKYQKHEDNDSTKSTSGFSNSTVQEINEINNAPLFISCYSPVFENHSKSLTILNSKFTFSNTVDILPKPDTSLGISNQDNEQDILSSRNLKSEITYDRKLENVVEEIKNCSENIDNFEDEEKNKIKEISKSIKTCSFNCNKVDCCHLEKSNEVLSFIKEHNVDVLENNENNKLNGIERNNKNRNNVNQMDKTDDDKDQYETFIKIKACSEDIDNFEEEEKNKIEGITKSIKTCSFNCNKVDCCHLEKRNEVFSFIKEHNVDVLENNENNNTEKLINIERQNKDRNKVNQLNKADDGFSLEKIYNKEQLSSLNEDNTKTFNENKKDVVDSLNLQHSSHCETIVTKNIKDLASDDDIVENSRPYSELFTSELFNDVKSLNFIKVDERFEDNVEEEITAIIKSKQSVNSEIEKKLTKNQTTLNEKDSIQNILPSTTLRTSIYGNNELEEDKSNVNSKLMEDNENKQHVKGTPSQDDDDEVLKVLPITVFTKNIHINIDEKLTIADNIIKNGKDEIEEIHVRSNSPNSVKDQTFKNQGEKNIKIEEINNITLHNTRTNENDDLKKNNEFCEENMSSKRIVDKTYNKSYSVDIQLSKSNDRDEKPLDLQKDIMLHDTKTNHNDDLKGNYEFCEVNMSSKGVIDTTSNKSYSVDVQFSINDDQYKKSLDPKKDKNDEKPSSNLHYDEIDTDLMESSLKDEQNNLHYGVENANSISSDSSMKNVYKGEISVKKNKGNKMKNVTDDEETQKEMKFIDVEKKGLLSQTEIRKYDDYEELDPVSKLQMQSEENNKEIHETIECNKISFGKNKNLEQLDRKSLENTHLIKKRNFEKNNINAQITLDSLIDSSEYSSFTNKEEKQKETNSISIEENTLLNQIERRENKNHDKFDQIPPYDENIKAKIFEHEKEEQEKIDINESIKSIKLPIKKNELFEPIEIQSNKDFLEENTNEQIKGFLITASERNPINYNENNQKERSSINIGEKTSLNNKEKVENKNIDEFVRNIEVNKYRVEIQDSEKIKKEHEIEEQEKIDEINENISGQHIDNVRNCEDKEKHDDKITRFCENVDGNTEYSVSSSVNLLSEQNEMNILEIKSKNVVDNSLLIENQYEENENRKNEKCKLTQINVGNENKIEYSSLNRNAEIKYNFNEEDKNYKTIDDQDFELKETIKNDQFQRNVDIYICGNEKEIETLSKDCGDKVAFCENINEEVENNNGNINYSKNLLENENEINEEFTMSIKNENETEPENNSKIFVNREKNESIEINDDQLTREVKKFDRNVQKNLLFDRNSENKSKNEFESNSKVIDTNIEKNCKTVETPEENVLCNQSRKDAMDLETVEIVEKNKINNMSDEYQKIGIKENEEWNLEKNTDKKLEKNAENVTENCTRTIKNSNETEVELHFDNENKRSKLIEMKVQEDNNSEIYKNQNERKVDNKEDRNIIEKVEKELLTNEKSFIDENMEISNKNEVLSEFEEIEENKEKKWDEIDQANKEDKETVHKNTKRKRRIEPKLNDNKNQENNEKNNYDDQTSQLNTIEKNEEERKYEYRKKLQDKDYFLSEKKSNLIDLDKSEEEKKYFKNQLEKKKSNKVDTFTDVSTENNIMHYYQKANLSCWKLFLISFILAILFLLLSLVNLPLLYSCDGYYIHVLKKINPFSIQRYAPI